MTTVTLAMAALAMVVALRALATARTHRLRERGTFAGLLEELAAVEAPPTDRLPPKERLPMTRREKP